MPDISRRKNKYNTKRNDRYVDRSLPQKSSQDKYSYSTNKAANDIKNDVDRKTYSTSESKNSQNNNVANYRRGAKRKPYNKRRLDEDAKDIQWRAISGQNGTGVLHERDKKTTVIPTLDIDWSSRQPIFGKMEIENKHPLDKAFDAGGKFISNFMDSVTDYSPIGGAYTIATGKTLTGDAYKNNPYETQRQQGISSTLGRMAGMMTDYALMRSAFNPVLEKTAGAVLNGTKLGQAIQGSSVLGKIGQSVGTNALNKMTTGLVKETISDATLGFGQNALVNYGSGLRGSDFWKQQAIDTALDFGVGGAMEGFGVAKQIKNANTALKQMSAESATDFLKGAKTKDEYIDALINRANEQMDIGYEEGIAPKLKKAASDKSNEFLDEAAKVDKMTAEQFNRYKSGRNLDENVKYHDTTRDGTAKNAHEGDIEAAKNTPVEEQEKFSNRPKPNEEVDVNAKGEPVSAAKEKPTISGLNKTRRKISKESVYNAYSEDEIAKAVDQNKATVNISSNGEVTSSPKTDTKPKAKNSKSSNVETNPKSETSKGVVANEAKGKEAPKANKSKKVAEPQVAEPQEEMKIGAEPAKKGETKPKGKAENTKAKETGKSKPQAEIADKSYHDKMSKYTEPYEFSAKDAIDELDSKGETHLGRYGHISKKSDGSYNLFVNGEGDKALSRAEVEAHIDKAIKRLNADEERIAHTRVTPLTEAENARVKEIDEKVASLNEESKEAAEQLKKNKYKDLDKYDKEAAKRGHEVTELKREEYEIIHKEPTAEKTSKPKEKTSAETNKKKKSLPTKKEQENAKVEATQKPKEETGKQKAENELPKKEEVEAKAPAKKATKAKVHNNLKKEVIISRMQEAGIEFPNDPNSYTKEQLLALNRGDANLEEVVTKAKNTAKGKKAKKTEIDLFEYDDIYASSKNDNVIKEKLLDKYTKNKESLGEPLSKEDIEKLKGLDADQMYEVVEQDVLKRSGFKTVDDYYDHRLAAKEAERPELVRTDKEVELRSDKLNKGKSDAYTADNGEINPYTGKAYKNVSDTQAAKKIVPYLERHFATDSHPTTKFIGIQLDMKEDEVRKFIEESGDYVIKGEKSNVYPKESASVTAGAPEAKATETMSGYTMTMADTTSGKGKKLPKKLTRQNAEQALERRYNKALENQYAKMSDESLTKSNKTQKQNKKVLDTSKLDNIKVDTSGDIRTTVDIGAPKEKTVKERWTSFKKKVRRDIIDSSDELRQMDKAIGNTKLEETYKMSQGSRAQAAHQLIIRATDRNGNALKFKDKDGNVINRSFRDVFKDYKNNMDDITSYMMYKHEIDRSLQSNKNSLSLSIFGYNKEEAEQAANAVVSAFPEMKAHKDDISSWLQNGMQNDSTYRAFKKEFDGFDNVIQKLNSIKSEKAKNAVSLLEEKYGKAKLDKLSKEFNETYNKWFDEWAIKSGLVDKDLVKEWRGKYHNYIPTFRVKDVGSGAMRTLDSPDVFHSVKGNGNEAKLLGVEDQLGIMIGRVTNAARRNEMNLGIYKAIKDNPGKGFGRILSVSDDAIGDIDNALKEVGASTSDVINGSKKMSVLVNGKKVTMEISDELAATLRAMQDGADTGIMTRLGKSLTNPIKFGITGGNPTFVVANALRDMATALIQSEHGMGKTVSGWGKAIKGMTGLNKEYADLLKRYKFAGGEMAGYYVQGKGFDTSALLQKKGIKGVLNKVGEVLSFLGEQGETVPRFGEFINTMEKTGDFYKAVRDAAEVTVDFSKHGASDGAKLLDAWTLYLNAGLQGIDKFARVMAKNPVRTTGRAALVVGLPAAMLLAVNNDNPWYQELSDRTRQNYFCIPKLDGEKDSDGNCKEFIRLPMNREYGAVIGAGLDSIWRAIKGDENPTSGFATTIKENFLPSNPLTDNVLAPLLINIPTNKDYKDAKILTSSEFEDFKAGKNADLQYDASTSNAAMDVAKLANKIMGDKNIPILKYIKSPKLVDYLLDSYGGYYGQVTQAGTMQGNKTLGDAASNVLIKPYTNKFSADPRYSSQTIDRAFDTLAEYKSEQKRAASEGNEWSEAHAKYDAAYKVMKSIYDSMDAEKAIKEDPNLTQDEKDKQIKELREARIELAKTIEDEADAAAKEYKEAPTFSSLNDTAKEKWTTNLGLTKEEWAKNYKEIIDTYNEKMEETGYGTTIGEKRFRLLENGITSYEVAQSILGKNTSKTEWEDAIKSYKDGVTLKDVEEEARLEAEKRERQKNMTTEEKKFENYFKESVTKGYDGKTVSQSVVDEYIARAKYADSQNDKNGSIRQAEARAALDSMPNLTRAQKAYLWSISSDWKTNPYN